MDKRTFLKSFSLLSMSTLTGVEALATLVDNHQNIPLSTLKSEEDFWKKIRAAYKINPDYINLENGYYCLMPEETLEKYIKRVRDLNFEASHYLRTQMADDQRMIREMVAEMAGCSNEELILTRNTTESLDMIIAGLNWVDGDEAIMARQDYGAMLNMFRLVNERYGVVNKKISLPNHPKSDEEIVALYESKINERTKLIMVSHVVNITGQVLPVKKICDMAHSHGVDVMVDGAHAFAHLDFKIPDLNCDYYGTSLHKWLSAPIGNGFLYVNKTKIENIWPLMAENVKPLDDIDRLNHKGTTPVHAELGIADAIAFHQILGAKRKEARLRYLKTYWTSKLKDNSKILINTPWEEERSCAIANVLVRGYKPNDLAKKLMNDYNIWTVAINRSNVKGCRITPNVFTSTQELDQLVDALNEIAANFKEMNPVK